MAASSSPRDPKPNHSDEDEEENSPVEQVAITVSTRDDPTLPSVTFRTWVLGILSCVILSFLNQFFGFRRNPLNITAVSAQIAVVPLGHLMAKVLPTTTVFSGSRWAFSLNPGPFNVKEHVLITIFANSGAGGIYAIHIITSLKVFYRQHITFLMSFILVLTTQVLGFGWAGIFRKYLVEPAAMWWPSNLVQVTLFRALHEKEERAKGGISRNQFFLIALLSSFAYYIFPGYLFSMLSSISWVCWIFPRSVTAQQIGSGLYGMGAGAFALDWSAVASYLGSPLASPWFATANVAAGYVIIMYILVPASYWLNVYKAKTFPIFSSHFFDSAGQRYETSSIINSNFQLDVDAYEKKGPLYLSTFFAMTYGVGFAALTATLSHVAIFNGKEIVKMTRSALNKEVDIHTKLMRKYKQVPEWWFQVILVANIALTIFVCEYYNDVLQLPWWGVLMACALSIFFTLPVGVISATTNQTPGLNIITEYIMGVILPGQPAANVCFKTYGYISTIQALTFLADFKLGHYMKIPPRSMFMAQVVGTVIAAFVYLATAWWLLEGIPYICNVDLLPADSPWTCPMDRVFYDASVIWGLISPRRIFGDLGTYAAVNWFFLAGAISPVFVWIASKIFPSQKWIRLINMPVLIGATGILPPASSVNFNSWLVLGFISGFVVYRYKRNWWSKYNYVLSAALDAGLAFMGVLLYFTLQSNNVSLTWWGTNPDGCPLAECPTEKGIRGDDICPVYS